MAAQAVGEVLAFARQLVGRASRRTLRLRNAGLLPARWALAHREPLPAQFALSALGGLLAPAAEARVHVDFCAEAECCVAERLVLEVREQENSCIYDIMTEVTMCKTMRIVHDLKRMGKL